MFEMVVGALGLLFLGFIVKKGFDFVRFIIRVIINPISSIRNVYSFVYAMVVTIQRERSNYKNGVK